MDLIFLHYVLARGALQVWHSDQNWASEALVSVEVLDINESQTLNESTMVSKCRTEGRFWIRLKTSESAPSWQIGFGFEVDRHTSTFDSVCLWTEDGKKSKSPCSSALSKAVGSLVIISSTVDVIVA